MSNGGGPPLRVENAALVCASWPTAKEGWRRQMTRDAALFYMLADRGVTIDPDGRMVRIAGYAGANPLTDAQIRHHNERQGEHDVEALLKCYWTNDLAEMAEEIQKQGDAVPWPYRTAFYLRLNGVLHDERQDLINTFRGLKVDPNTAVGNPGSVLEWALDKFRCIEAIRKVFTEDELIYIDYLRQTNAHPTHAQYSVRWSDKNGGQVKDRRGISTLGMTLKEFTCAELNEAILRVLAPYTVDGRPNEWAIATSFAHRVREVVAPLVDLMRRSVERR
jgi:hypothetical protein